MRKVSSLSAIEASTGTGVCVISGSVCRIILSSPVIVVSIEWIAHAIPIKIHWYWYILH
jgi:hypothetical protein